MAEVREDVSDFLSKIREKRARRDSGVDIPNEKVNGVTLSDEQQAVVNGLKEFIDRPYDFNKHTASLSGSAGTGKSLTMKAVVNYMNGSYVKYRLCAPTHKAKYILAKYTNEPVDTIHSLLMLSPMIDVEDLDYNNLKFVGTSDKNKKIPKGGVILIDECSMVNTPLFEAFEKISLNYKVKIIYVGDPRQLRPVKENDISPTFDRSQLRFKLTKVFRQDSESALVPILIKLRDEVINEFETSRNEKGSLLVERDIKTFIKPCVNIIRNAMEVMDTDASKILCYRNARVKGFNELVRRCILKERADKEPFVKGEFLVGYENFDFENHLFYNSSDYIVASKPKITTVIIPQVGAVEGFSMEIYDKADDSTTRIPMIDIRTADKRTIYQWIDKLEELRLRALREKERRSGGESACWAKYFEVLRCCAINQDLVYQNRVVKKKTFDYGYAQTVHKSQGSSYTNVFVDMGDLFINRDKDELRQLQYVALSRTRSDVTILIKD